MVDRKVNRGWKERDIAFRYNSRRKKCVVDFTHARKLRNEYNREIHKVKCIQHHGST